MTSKILNSLPHLANDSVTKQVTDILSDLIVTGKIEEGDFLPTEEDLTGGIYSVNYYISTSRY